MPIQNSLIYLHKEETLLGMKNNNSYGNTYNTLNERKKKADRYHYLNKERISQNFPRHAPSEVLLKEKIQSFGLSKTVKHLSLHCCIQTYICCFLMSYKNTRE